MNENLASWQARFAKALMTENLSGLSDWLSDETGENFRVYLNNFTLGQAARLEQIYPAVKSALGSKVFFETVKHYAVQCKQTGKTLGDFGTDFSDFLKHEADLPDWLYELACFEQARHESLNAADVCVLKAKTLIPIGQKLTDSCFKPHPATRLITSKYPVLTIWKHARRSKKIQYPKVKRKFEVVLITRPAKTLKMTVLTPSEHVFAAALITGEVAYDAYQKALAVDRNFDSETAFYRLLRVGAFSKVILP